VIANIIILSLQVQSLLRLDTDAGANLMRVDGGIPLSTLEQREFLHRTLDHTRYMLSTLGRYPSAQSSHGSTNAPSMFASTSTSSGYPYDVGAGPSHVNAGKLNQHCTNIIYCTSVACANLL
jgi:hypothetical protein